MENISLRYYEDGDEKILFNDYTSDSSSSAYLARKTHESEDQTKDMLRRLSSHKSMSDNGISVLIIKSSESHRPLGMVTLVSNRESIEIHFGVCVSCRKKGIAKLAVESAVSYISGELNCKVIYCYPDCDNLGAVKVLESCGFQCLGKAEKFYRAPQKGGDYRDAFEFKLVV